MISAVAGRRVLAGGLAVAVLSTGISGWYATRVLAMERRLESVRAELLALDAEALASGEPSAGAALRRAHEQAAAAAGIAAGPSWRALVHVPVAGRPAGAVRDLAWAAERLTGTVVPELRRVRGMLASVPPEGIPAALATTEPVLARTAGELRAIHQRLAPGADPDLTDPSVLLQGTSSHPRPGTGVAAVDRAIRDAAALVQRALAGVSLGVGIARIMPGLMGGQGVRRYFLALQTNAEARGTGGLVGAYGILRASGGRLRLERLASNATLDTLARPAADLGPEFRGRYGPSGADRELLVSNLSPHFPYAARIWTAMWRERTGQRLDGAIATDAAGLAELLRVTGPLLVAGRRISAANAVEVIERAAYAWFDDQTARKRFLIQVSQAVAKALIGRPHPPVELARALGRMASAGRLRVWSARRAEQAVLAGSPFGGVLPDTPGPYAQLVVNNAGGNKLDHYLKRSLEYELGPCDATQRKTIVRIRLTNTAPARGLPAYVTPRADSPRRPRPPGSNRLWVSLYAAQGARLVGALRDGKATRLAMGEERTHPVFDGYPELLPGQSTEYEFQLAEPRSTAAPRVPVQPLTHPQATRVTYTAGCS